MTVIKSIPETDLYFYHPDHLGSSSFITDANGIATQCLQYLPYGETFINQQTNSIQSRYTFSGKEKDLETDYSYFGARYYNSDISIWLSVDPKSNDFPHISPYNYVEQNPVKYIDKKGENPIGALVGGLIGAATEIVSQTISNGFANMESGKGFFNNWGGNMDWADVGITAIEGALIGSGFGAAALPFINGGAAVARSGVDWKGDDKTPNVIFGQGDYKKDWVDFGLDIAGEALSLGIKYGSGLHKVGFMDYSKPDVSGAILKTIADGSIDGIWKTPTTYGKTNRNEIKEYIYLPEVEIYPPSHRNSNQNVDKVLKEYAPWFLKK